MWIETEKNPFRLEEAAVTDTLSKLGGTYNVQELFKDYVIAKTNENISNN